MPVFFISDEFYFMAKSLSLRQRLLFRSVYY